MTGLRQTAEWTGPSSSMGARINKRLVRSLMSRIRAYERFFKEKEKSQKKAGKKKKPTQEDKRVKDTGVEGTGALDTGVLEPDNQAHTAYVNLIKLVHTLEKDDPKEDAGVPEALTEERVREVLRDVYGI